MSWGGFFYLVVFDAVLSAALVGLRDRRRTNVL